MTTYLLHGGMIKQENASNAAYFARIAKALPEGGTLLIVLFAAEEHRWPELFDMMKGYFASTNRSDITFIEATREGFLDEVRQADAIVIRGGETNRLLEALRSYGDLRAVFEGKLIAGSSAGAYAFGRYNYSRSGQRIRDGLALIEAKVLCHYMSEDPNERNADDAVALMESEHAELPLIVLRDSEWKEIIV